MFTTNQMQPNTNIYYQNDNITPSQPPPMKQAMSNTTATLLVKHLPEAIPQETLTRLFSHYGASSIRPCTSGRLRNCAFVDFENEALAYQAQRQLNGLRFLSKTLSVERASNANGDNKRKHVETQTVNDNTPSASLQKDNLATRSLGEGSKSASIPASEPIAPRLGVEYPFPPHLEYAYPPPDGNILTNIVNALIAIPRFYTQVLHLMNKMNIPAPFRMAQPTPPLPPSAPAPPAPAPPAKHPLEDLSSSESEMESDKDVNGKSGKKRIKREAIVGPAVDKDVVHEAVGVKPASLVPKEIPVIKKRNPVLQIKIAAKSNQNENRDQINLEESEEKCKDDSDHRSLATREEIQKQKLGPEEILSLPKFKNYTMGNPASVLYIKNLAKDVLVEDFFYVFGSLFGSIDAAKSALNVKLMQEGRMRGQAFVTFPTVEIAHQALNLVNGFVYKGKPMIIQFGRNPSANKME